MAVPVRKASGLECTDRIACTIESYGCQMQSSSIIKRTLKLRIYRGRPLSDLRVGAKRDGAPGSTRGSFDLASSEIEGWVEDAKRGMENSLRANPLDIREHYEKQLKDLQEAYGEAMLELRARRKLQAQLDGKDGN